jgi:hypothetical protein
MRGEVMYTGSDSDNRQVIISSPCPAEHQNPDVPAWTGRTRSCRRVGPPARSKGIRSRPQK